VLVTDIPGTLFLNRIMGLSVVSRQDDAVIVEAGAGENWHDLVRWTIDQGLSGLENLSSIPGCAGAAPIQNIGAYGVELASVLDSVTAWDWRCASWVNFEVADCQLAYRDSRFKTTEPDRFLITSIRLRLSCRFEPVLDYAGLRDELASRSVQNPTSKDVSDAITRIRRRKLPDPAVTGNAGSFFKNPLISRDRAEQLLVSLPELVCWPAGPGMVKLSAAWLIERCGLKGEHVGDASVSEQHALVLVNRGNASGADILELARRVQQRVAGEFDVDLETEPRLVEFPV